MANLISDVWMQTAVVYFEMYAPESVIKAAIMASECLKGWFYEPENEDDNDLVIKPDRLKNFDNHISPQCFYQNQTRNGSPVASTSPQWLNNSIKRRHTSENALSLNSNASYSKSNSY